MRSITHWAALCSFGTCLAFAGCTEKPKDKTADPEKKVVKTDHGHSHDKGNMKLADCGKYHAKLTAHLSSKDGNELDIFIETQDADVKPVAVPTESFTAQVKVGDGDFKEVKFEAAPASERPKDEKPGTCSHFVAKTPWMKATDMLYVVAKIKTDSGESTAEWKEFNPKTYAHHVD